MISGGTSGTVTSVGLADGSTVPLFGISGSPVTTTGTLTFTLQTQSANLVLAGPTTGAAAQPTFRALVAADIPTGNLTDAGTDGITVTGGTGAVIGSGTSLSQHVADTTHNGYLSSTDWNTFNGKQAAGSYITALTGDGTAAGPGSVAFTLATVNGNVGSFGSSTAIPNFTVNGKGLITAAGTNVVIAPAGTLTGTTLASNVVTSSLTSLGTQSAALNMGSNKINAVTDPTSAQDAATKNYVDTVASGLNPKQAVYAATVGSSLTGTYSNGAAGVGATFTITATGAFTLDGTTPPVLSRILLKDQTSGFQNGVYDLTVAGTTGVSPILTRSLDYNTAIAINAGDLIPVINGTVNTQTSWLQTATITTIGTDSLVFVQWTANPSSYLLKANNLSDVSSKSTSFNNLSPMTTLGDTIYGGASGTGTRLAGNTASTTQLLSSVGSGGLATAPVWLTATSTNTASAPVIRDGSGNFSSGTITAALTGTASGNTTYTANNHGVVLSGSGNTMTVIAPDASVTKVLTSGGASADPTWAAPASAATAVYSNGFFDASYSWTTTSASYVDPTNGGTGSFTVRKSSGLTVTAAASNNPGITFTPATNTAVFLITFSFGAWNGTTNQVASLQATDGTAVIADGGARQGGSTTAETSVTLMGIYAPASTSATTVKLQMKTGGTGTANLAGASANNNAINWTVVQIVS